MEHTSEPRENIVANWKHTPGPWKREGYLIIVDRKTRRRCAAIASICTTATMIEKDWEANAEFIVRACNSHDDLLEACKALSEYVSGQWLEEWENRPNCLRIAEQAISQAEGKEV